VTRAAIALLALGALYMLGRSLGRTLGPAPALDDIDWLGEFRSPTNSITLAYPTNPAATWRN